MYVSIDLIVINLYLGPTLVGYYAPFVQLVLLVTLLVDAISGVFSPIAYEYISNDQMSDLILQTKRTLKFLGIFIALPIGIICGFAEPLLSIWLGGSFPDFYILMWILLLPGLLTHPISPMFAINRGLNKVKYPAIITLVGGIANVLLSIFSVKYTSLGVYGIGLATAICYLIKNYFFTPMYCSYILGIPCFTFYKDIHYGLIGGGFIFGFSLFIVRYLNIDTAYKLLFSASAVSALYVIFAIFLLLLIGELKFFFSLITNLKHDKG